MDQKQFFNNLFEPYFHTFQSMDDRMIGIMSHRAEYEKRLDDMWQNYCRGCMMQVVDYKAQVKYIKENYYMRKHKDEGLKGSGQEKESEYGPNPSYQNGGRVDKDDLVTQMPKK